jgi:hypothetical protein
LGVRRNVPEAQEQLAMTRFMTHSRARFALLCMAALMFAGCRSATAPERHVRPSGVVVMAGAVEVVRVEGTTVTNSFTVPAGGQTGLLTFTFLDAQGNPITPAGDYHLELRFASEAIATFAPQGSPYTFTGRIQGVQAGTTTVQMRLMHGPPGAVGTHADYTSPGVGVAVQ